MMISRTLSSALLVGLLVALTGCANPTMGNPPPAGVTSASLQVIGTTSRDLNEFAEEIVQVQYLDQDAQPIAEATVEFGLLGNVAGATLSASAAAFCKVSYDFCNPSWLIARVFNCSCVFSS